VPFNTPEVKIVIFQVSVIKLRDKNVEEMALQKLGTYQFHEYLDDSLSQPPNLSRLIY